MIETIEYRTVDKSTWSRGPWDDEPDKVQWADEATGLACLVVRGPHGSLCGYVGVPNGHPWHGAMYDDVGRYHPKPADFDEEWYLDVHGGLTFSAGCQHGPDPSTGICHIPGPGEPDDTWWLGFDCAHAGDLTGMAWRSKLNHSMGWPGDVYRDLNFVRAECGRLAAQANAAAIKL